MTQHQPHQQPPINMMPYDPSQRLAPSPARSTIAPVATPAAHPQANAYNPPRAPEVYRLEDGLNDRIPPEVREQFQRDDQGRVLFFTQPPLDRAHRGLAAESAGLGHSVRYLADRARENEDLANSRREKRKARDELRKQEEFKKLEVEEDAKKATKDEVVDVAGDALLNWMAMMNRETELLKQQYDGWSVKDKDIDAIERAAGLGK
jgi:chromatin structure-remodeling complex subunit RSC1/2